MSNDHDLLRNPAALLVLRVWIERGSALPLRAYSRRTADVSRGFEQSSVDTDIEAAVATVRTWLEGLLDPDSSGNAPAVTLLGGHGLATEVPADGLDRLKGSDPESGAAATNGVDSGH